LTHTVGIRLLSIASLNITQTISVAISQQSM